jgi:hypothetical protein
LLPSVFLTAPGHKPERIKNRSEHSKRILPTLTGADTQRVLEREDKDFAVADFSRVGRFANSLQNLFALIIKNRHLNLDLRQEIDAVLRTTVAFNLAFLSSGPSHVCNGHADDTDIRKRLLNILKAMRPNDRKYQFHSAYPRSRA